MPDERSEEGKVRSTVHRVEPAVIGLVVALRSSLPAILRFPFGLGSHNECFH
jgi:hypothetical protein